MKKRLVIAGGMGFMGDILQRELHHKYEITVLCRDNKLHNNSNYLYWDGENIDSWTLALEGAYGLINLSGRTVNCRYNQRNKDAIYASRLNSTRALGNAMKLCTDPPKVWLNAASATIYRHAEDRPMTEMNGEFGHGFSVDVCRKWEAAFFEFEIPGVRQVAMRTAIVLGKNGGVLRPLKNLVRFGLGGKMGKGTQMFSWIHEKDLANAIDFLLDNDACDGVYNLASPGPLPNERFMKLLRAEMQIPVAIPTPKWLLEIGAVLIQTETELVLKSRWVLPQRLQEAGFTFQFSEMSEALGDLIRQH
jgi:uncharacterized protein (TIGR01777 family)